MKIIVNKMVGEGEQFAIEVNVGDDIVKKEGVEGIQARIAPALKVVDERLLELNTRLLNANRMAQKLPPEAAFAMRQCVDVLWGRQTPPQDLPQVQQAEEGDRDAAKKDSLELKADALAKALEGVDAGQDA